MISPQIIDFKYFDEDGGKLMVAENIQIYSDKFRIERIFMVEAINGAVRGMHAHIKCSQILVAIHGKILVSCETRLNQISEYCLDSPNKGLFVPPGIWAFQTYLGDMESKLLVLCDHEYDECDYIRDYQEFLGN